VKAQLRGNVAPERVADWMRVADVLVLPSYSEGYPNVLVEALACGCPIVATHVGGIAEIVAFDTGILIPPRDSEALAKAVISALSRAWDRKAFEKWNRSWDTVADETLQACGTALHLAPGGF